MSCRHINPAKNCGVFLFYMKVRAIDDFCWYVWQCQAEKTYPLPPVLWGFFISYSEYQRFMVSAINMNLWIIPKVWRCPLDMFNKLCQKNGSVDTYMDTNEKRVSDDLSETLDIRGSGERIWTSDLRVMSPNIWIYLVLPTCLCFNIALKFSPTLLLLTYLFLPWYSQNRLEIRLENWNFP